MSSLPFASDIPALKDLRVGAVVNMCREWPGPTQAYKDAGLKQLQLATQDTCAPSVDSLERGVSFISEHLRENPGSRVLIHCKSGRGRAATMALAWFVAQGHSPDTAVEWMQNKRSVIEPKVSEYSSLVEIAKQYAHVEPASALENS